MNQRQVLSEYSISRDNNFNLIRFIAASLVLFSHSFVLLKGPGDTEPGIFGITLSRIAVDLFFVTSGFLVTKSLVERNNLTEFIWARMLRIYPALITAVCFCILIIGVYFTTLPIYSYFHSYETFRYLIKNITLFFGISYYLPGVFENLPYRGVINGSLWTLPYEVRMYAILVIAGGTAFTFKKYYKRDIFSFTIVIILLAVVINYFTNIVKLNEVNLFYLFFTGSIIYILKSNIILSKRVLIVLCLSLVLSKINKNVFFVLYSPFLAYITIYLAYIPGGFIRKFNKIGDYSYGMYIFAFPVQQSIAALIPDISAGLMIIYSFTITFFLAIFSWHVIEKRFLKFKNILNKV